MIEPARVTVRFTGKWLVILAASLTLTSFAQSSAPSPATALPLAGTPVVSEPPVFEVTTVKLNKSGGSGSHSSFDNGRFTASNILLKNLIQYQAYGIPEPRILGGPKWLTTERFDIEAKAESS